MCTGTQKAKEVNVNVTLTPAQLDVVKEALTNAYDRSGCTTSQGVIEASAVFGLYF